MTTSSVQTDIRCSGCGRNLLVSQAEINRRRRAIEQTKPGDDTGVPSNTIKAKCDNPDCPKVHRASFVGLDLVDGVDWST